MTHIGVKNVENKCLANHDVAKALNNCQSRQDELVPMLWASDFTFHFSSKILITNKSTDRKISTTSIDQLREVCLNVFRTGKSDLS